MFRINFSSKFGGGSVRLEFEDPRDKEKFANHVNRCLDDPHLLDTQISEETKLELNKTPNSNAIIEDLCKLGKDENKQSQKITSKTTKCINSSTKLPTVPLSAPTTTTATTTTTHNSGISNRKFYQNHFSVNNSKYDKENSSDYFSKTYKRRYSQSYLEENFAEPNDENRQIVSGQSPQSTPKRNCVNNSITSTPSSSGNSFQKWNRNNSMGKSSGGKG